MEEAAIASQLASELRAKQQAEQIQQPQVTVQPSTPTEEGYVFDKPLDDFSIMRIYDFFQVPSYEQSNPKTQKMMDTIVKWAFQNGAQQYHDVIGQVRNIQQSIRKDDLYHIYEYVRIQSQIARLDNEMRNLYG